MDIFESLRLDHVSILETFDDLANQTVGPNPNALMWKKARPNAWPGNLKACETTSWPAPPIFLKAGLNLIQPGSTSTVNKCGNSTLAAITWTGSTVGLKNPISRYVASDSLVDPIQNSG